MVTLTIWTTTGTGEAKNLAFCGVTEAPPASSAIRDAPAITGMRLRRIRAAGTAHEGPRRGRVRLVGSRMLLGFAVMAWSSVQVVYGVHLVGPTLGVRRTLVKRMPLGKGCRDDPAA